MSPLLGILIGIEVVIVLILIAWLVLERQSRAWQGRSDERLAQIDGLLETLGEGVEQAEAEARAYPPDAPDPYGPPARELHRALEQARTDLDSQTRQLDRLREETFLEPGELLRIVWTGFRARPGFYRGHYHDVEALWGSAQELETQLAGAQNLLGRLEGMPWQVAQRSRDLLNAAQSSLGMARALGARGIDKATLVPILESLERSETDLLKQVPDYFLSGTRHQVMDRATKEDTIDAWRRLNDVEMKAQPHIQKVHRWQSVYQALDGYNIGNMALLNRIAVDMEGTANLPEYPIAWQDSRRELQDLRGLQTRIGGPDSRRAPDQLDVDLARAKKLESRARALEAEVAKARRWRDKLAPLLVNPNLAAPQTWMEPASKLHKAAKAYDVRNWATGDKVPSIARDANGLAKRHKNLAAPLIDRPLPEGTLNQKLFDDLQRLTSDLEKYEERLARVTARLVELQAEEQAAQATLDGYLQSLAPLIRHFEGVGGEAQAGSRSAEAQHTANSLETDGQKLSSQLQKRQSGLVSNKARGVEKWASDCPGQLEKMLKDLRAEVEDLDSQLGDQVRATERIAPFDQERAMEEARRLLGTKYTFAPPRAKGTGGNPLGPLVAQANELLDRLVALGGSLSAIREQIREPLRYRYGTLERRRDKAATSLEDLEAMAAEAGPNVSVDVGRIRSQIEDADRGLARLKRSGRTVSQVRHGLDELTRRYEGAADEAAEMARELQ